jgi:hypothetical protein
MDISVVIGLGVVALLLLGASGQSGAAALQNAVNALNPRSGYSIEEWAWRRCGTGAAHLALAAYLYLVPVPFGAVRRDYVLIAAAAAAAWGALWLLVGLSKSAGARDPLAALMAILCELCPGAAGLWWLPGWGWPPLLAYLGKGCCIYLVSYGLTVVVLSLRGSGGNALRPILREIDRRNAPLRAPRPGRRFFFWW